VARPSGWLGIDVARNARSFRNIPRETNLVKLRQRPWHSACKCACLPAAPCSTSEVHRSEDSFVSQVVIYTRWDMSKALKRSVLEWQRVYRAVRMRPPLVRPKLLVLFSHFLKYSPTSSTPTNTARTNPHILQQDTTETCVIVASILFNLQQSCDPTNIVICCADD
jgi:hypothetical protein